MATVAPRRHLQGADGLRAFACLLVLFHHVALSFTFKTGPRENWLGRFVPIGGYGVVIFFVLSGFLLARPFWYALQTGDRRPSLNTYFLRRFARIVPGFWLSMLLSLILALALGQSSFDLTTVLRFVSGLFFLNSFNYHAMFPVEINGPLWSISLEIGSYFLMPLGFALLFAFRTRVSGFGGRVALWTGVIAATIGLHQVYVHAFGIPPRPDFKTIPFTLENLGLVWFPRFNIFGLFATFATGVLAAAVRVRLGGWRSSKADVLAALSLLGALVYLFGVTRPFRPDASLVGLLDLPYNGYPLLPLLLAVFLAFAPSSRYVGQILDGSPLRYLARISFGIYIYHVLVLTLLEHFVFGSGVPAASVLQSYGLLAATLGVTIAAAHLSWYRLEQPIIRWARGLEYRSPQAAAESSAF